MKKGFVVRRREESFRSNMEKICLMGLLERRENEFQKKREKRVFVWVEKKRDCLCRVNVENKREKRLFVPHLILRRSVATTLMGLQKELETAAQELRSVDPTISLISGTELFLRFVTRAGTGTGGGFEEVKAVLLDRAEKFLERSVVARNTIGKIVVERFLADG